MVGELAMSSRRGRSQYDRWADAFDQAWRDPSRVSSIECPSCGSLTLRLVYILDSDGVAEGMYAFWCGTCLRGFPPGFGSLPSGALTVNRGQKLVPNYLVVVDD